MAPLHSYNTNTTFFFRFLNSEHVKAVELFVNINGETLDE